MCSLEKKFQEKIFTSNKVIKVWKICNFVIQEIKPKNLVTLRFLKFLNCYMKIGCKLFHMSHWWKFYIEPSQSNIWFNKLGKWRVYMQGTVANCQSIAIKRRIFQILHFHATRSTWRVKCLCNLAFFYIFQGSFWSILYLGVYMSTLGRTPYRT